MKNEILQELWRHRDEFARQYNYDIDKMVVALQQMENQSLTKIVDRRKKNPNPALHRTRLLASAKPPTA